MNDKDILNFFFELGQLKKIEHEGWRLAGVNHPETVSDHALRAAQIGFVLAKLEHYENPYQVCTMVVFHDITECRTGDVHKVANRYIDRDEKRAIEDQLNQLEEIGEEIKKLWQQTEMQSNKAGTIAHDADFLEMALTAKEYIEQGHSLAQDWINNVAKALQTKSAKELLNSIKEVKSTDWWQGLKKI